MILVINSDNSGNNGNNNKSFNEEDLPDLRCSAHAIIKSYSEKLIKLMSDSSLHLRLRYPITGDFHPKCLLSKILTYERVICANTSVSILDDIIPIIIHLMQNKSVGIYNLVNPGEINLLDLKIYYKNYIDHTLTIEEYNIVDHDAEIGPRSHVVLATDKITAEYTIPDINTSIKNVFKKMLEYCHPIMQCLCCNSTNKLLLDLKYQPLANNFHQQYEICPIYPLKLMYCSNCFHCQLSHAVNPEVLFKNYKYVSGTSQTGLTFFKENAEFISTHVGFHVDRDRNRNRNINININRNRNINSDIDKNEVRNSDKDKNEVRNKMRDSDKDSDRDKNESRNEIRDMNIQGNILDIACNDGSQLNYFKMLGWNTYGVDPATNLCPIAEKNGHVIICDFWTDQVADKLPKMDIITAQNVFAHTQHVDGFLNSCKKVMHENTSLFIQTSQKNMVINGEFDTTYHEHISFFNTKSMQTLIERNGLILTNVFENQIHGTSYIFEIKLPNRYTRIGSPSVQKYLDIESSFGLYSNILYDRFNLNAKRAVNMLRYEIDKYRTEYKCIGFGAAAKGQTVLCYGNIDFDYIIDENQLKIGTYSPKLDIPIVNLNHFNNDTSKKFLIVILAWNFAEEIKGKICTLNKTKKANIVIIEKYFPDLVLAHI